MELSAKLQGFEVWRQNLTEAQAISTEHLRATKRLTPEQMEEEGAADLENTQGG